MSEPLIARIRAEYGALPGLKLTLPQACRLWSVDARACELAFKTLIDDGFLAKAPTGTYMALPGAEGMLKAALGGRAVHMTKS